METIKTWFYYCPKCGDEFLSTIIRTFCYKCKSALVETKRGISKEDKERIRRCLGYEK